MSLIKEIRLVTNPSTHLQRINEQGSADEMKSLPVQSKVMERLAQTAKAIET
jgi:hypothetical protein